MTHMQQLSLSHTCKYHEKHSSNDFYLIYELKDKKKQHFFNYQTKYFRVTVGKL